MSRISTTHDYHTSESTFSCVDNYLNEKEKEKVRNKRERKPTRRVWKIRGKGEVAAAMSLKNLEKRLTHEDPNGVLFNVVLH